MQRIEILLISLLVTFSQRTNSSRFRNWQTSLIEGGSAAAAGEFPYMVSVRNNLPSGISYCGGSIINNWYILTAAHCVVGGSTALIKVVVGTNKFIAFGVNYAVSRIITHEAADLYTNNNDIALLRLETPVAYRETVKPVTLPNQDEITVPGTVCILTGWGKTSSSALSYPFNLQKLQLKTIPNSECRKYYTYMSDIKICATAGSGKGACIGDSGGPLICGGKQVGVLRGGGKEESICTTPLPIEFLYVPKYIDWIKQHAV